MRLNIKFNALHDANLLFSHLLDSSVKHLSVRLQLKTHFKHNLNALNRSTLETSKQEITWPHPTDIRFALSDSRFKSAKIKNKNLLFSLSGKGIYTRMFLTVFSLEKKLKLKLSSLKSNQTPTWTQTSLSWTY